MSRACFKNDVLRFSCKPDNKPKQTKLPQKVEQAEQEQEEVVKQVNWAAKSSLSSCLFEGQGLSALQKIKLERQQAGKPFIKVKKSNDEKEEQKSLQSYRPYANLLIVDKTPLKPPNESEQQKPQEKKKHNKKDSPSTNLSNESPQKEQSNKQKAKSNNKKPKKQKKIMKNTQRNMVKLDLKRKYTDRLTGNIYMNKRMYTRNGLLKQKYRKKAQTTQIELFLSQSYDIYLSSISRALYITIDSEGEIKPNQKIQIKGTSKQELQVLIKQIWGFQSFRYGQYETIKNTLEGKSTLFVSQTGSGKSLSYILSSILQDGLCIVISPLISLMLDQISSIPEILPAACISSLLNHDQKNRIIEMVKANRIKLLYMTPQALQTDLVYLLKSFPPVNFVCVDQAHCVSQLSHNFRTSYLIINELITNHFKFKNDRRVVMCLTATANKQTVKSIIDKMGIEELVRSDSLQRKNLCVTISRETHDSYRALVGYLKTGQLRKLKGVLVYCRTKRIMYQVFNYLSSEGFQTAVFHGGLEQKEKTLLLQNFRTGVIKVVAATIALGMGLDFENLDCVIHMNMPKSVESYVQEIGRAGRRGKRAFCHMFLSKQDYMTNRNFILAERLEMDNIVHFVNEIQKYSHIYKKWNFDQEQISKTSKEKNLKRDPCQEEPFLSDLQNSFQATETNKEKKRQSNPKQGRISYALTKQITQTLDSKIQSIVTILLKIQKLSDKKLLSVLAPSYEVLKISFYKTNQKALQQQCKFFKDVTKNAKNYKGSLQIRLIDKCNQLNMDPIDLISQLKQLSGPHFLKIEYQRDVVLWRYIGEISFQEFRKSYQQQLFNEMQQYDSNSITKLDILYTIAFNNSNSTVEQMIKTNKLGEFQKQYGKVASVSDLFDEYFTTPSDEFYHKIIGGEHYIPTWKLQNEQKQQVKVATKAFLKNQMSINPSVNPAHFIKKFRSGRIIARVLLGVNSETYNWRVYGNHPYWGRLKQYDYEEVKEEVANGVQEFTEEN